MSKERDNVSAMDYTIRSVQTALRILALFIPENEPLSLTEISRQLSLNKSMALRMTATLAGLGYLRTHPETRKYLLGTTSLRLGLAAYGALDLHKVAQPILSRLANATGCAVHLASNEHNAVVVIDKISPEHKSFSLCGSQIGGILPTFCTGIGLLFLSQEDDVFIRHYLENTDRVRYTPSTMVDVDAIMARIDQIRKDDICINKCEHEAGIVSIACPIRSHARRIIAGLSICSVREVLNDMDMSFIQGQVRAAATEISHQLGCQDTICQADHHA